MLHEKERLEKLLREKTISARDYKILLAALEKKPSYLKLVLLFLVNPFQKIAGFKALLLGLVIIASMSYLGVITRIYFTSILGLADAVDFAHTKFPITFHLLFYQNLVIWFTLSLLFVIAAKILGQKKVRILDFFGTCALSRFPYLLFLAMLSIIVLIHFNFHPAPPHHFDPAQQGYYPVQMSWFSRLLNMVYVGFFFWQIATYFYAFKESSGLVGKKLVLSFVPAIVLGEVITTFLILMLI